MKEELNVLLHEQQHIEEKHLHIATYQIIQTSTPLPVK
jgi:hypothetical protein